MNEKMGLEQIGPNKKHAEKEKEYQVKRELVKLRKEYANRSAVDIIDDKSSNVHEKSWCEPFYDGLTHRGNFSIGPCENECIECLAMEALIEEKGGRPKHEDEEEFFPDNKLGASESPFSRKNNTKIENYLLNKPVDDFKDGTMGEKFKETLSKKFKK